MSSKKTNNQSIPLTDLRPENNLVQKSVLGRIQKNVLDASRFIEGPELESFERNFARYCGARHCLGTASGTDAIRTALLACGIGVGDEVVTTPVTYVATPLAIAHTDAKPVFVDTLPDGNIDPTKVPSAITARTKAILAVHMYGNPCDMAALKKIAKKHRLLLIDDCSHAHGAEYHGERIGSLADASCFSFYPTKNLGAWGDAGAITTNDKKIAERAYLYKNYGEEKTSRNYAKVLGYNSKLDPIQAIVLDEKLQYLDEWNQKRRQAAAYYRKGLAGIQGLTLLPFAEGTSYYVFPVLTAFRTDLRGFLAKKGIQTAVHYPQAMHLEECFQDLGYKKGDFPSAERHAENVLSLPFGSSITRAEQDKVIQAIKEFFTK